MAEFAKPSPDGRRHGRGIFHRRDQTFQPDPVTPEPPVMSNISPDSTAIIGDAQTGITIPAPDRVPWGQRKVGRRKALGILATTAGGVGLVAAGGIGALLAKDSTEPKTAPKPTTTGGNNGEPTSIATSTQTEQPTNTSTPTPTRTPDATPTAITNRVETAIQTGVIEFTEPGEWEKYFTAISPEEAQKLLAEANNAASTRDQYRVLFPFDPRTSPDLVVEATVNPTTGSKKIGYANIAPNTVIYAGLSGIAELAEGSFSATGARVSTLTAVDARNNFFTFTFHRENATPTKQPNKEVSAGTPLITVSEAPITEPFYTPTPYQAISSLGFNERQATTATMSNFLQKDGKFAFVKATQ